jgi:hypothetical protein
MASHIDLAVSKGRGTERFLRCELAITSACRVTSLADLTGGPLQTLRTNGERREGLF